MNGVEVVIPCPYCNGPSTLFTGRDPRTGEAWLDHECPRCGGRQVDEVQMALGWARHEARAGTMIEPLYRHEGRWFGRTTGEEFLLAPVPEGECDYFPAAEARP